MTCSSREGKNQRINEALAELRDRQEELKAVQLSSEVWQQHDQAYREAQEQAAEAGRADEGVQPRAQPPRTNLTPCRWPHAAACSAAIDALGSVVRLRDDFGNDCRAAQDTRQLALHTISQAEGARIPDRPARSHRAAPALARRSGGDRRAHRVRSAPGTRRGRTASRTSTSCLPNMSINPVGFSVNWANPWTSWRPKHCGSAPTSRRSSGDLRRSSRRCRPSGTKHRRQSPGSKTRSSGSFAIGPNSEKPTIPNPCDTPSGRLVKPAI